MDRVAVHTCVDLFEMDAAYMLVLSTLEDFITIAESAVFVSDGFVCQLVDEDVFFRASTLAAPGVSSARALLSLGPSTKTVNGTLGL